jgi:hypothetical protein
MYPHRLVRAKAWKHATGEERREIVNLLASSVALAPDVEPRATWLTKEELARAYQ